MLLSCSFVLLGKQIQKVNGDDLGALRRQQMPGMVLLVKNNRLSRPDRNCFVILLH